VNQEKQSNTHHISTQSVNLKINNEEQNVFTVQFFFSVINIYFTKSQNRAPPPPLIVYIGSIKENNFGRLLVGQILQNQCVFYTTIIIHRIIA